MSNAVATSVTPAASLTDAKQSESSNQHESEYDTASDSPSDDDDDLQSGEYDDDIHSSEDDEDDDLHSDAGEEQEGEEAADGEGEDGEKKKVDDDEDRSNPQYIPKKGTFYEHDDRTAENPLGKPASEEPVEQKAESAENVSSTASPLPVKPVPKKPSGGDRWSHDRFDMSEQAPKSRSELVSAYGYDIRSEDGPPKVKRSKHYGRGPTKYDRNWEDENAYGKQVVAKRVPRGPPKGEDFPKLNERRPKKSHHSQSRDDQGSNNGEHQGPGSEEGRSYNNNHRERRQGGERGGGDRRRGSEKSREFKNRNPGGGRREGGGGHRDSSHRSNRRRDDGGDSHGRRGEDQDSQQNPPFNGMSFSNSSHGRRLENVQNDQGKAGQGNAVDTEEAPQRMIPTANSSRSTNYGSGRLQRRDEKGSGSSAQHYPQQSSGGVTGGLPLHAPVPGHHQQQQAGPPKRYSEKRQGMRSEQQQSQPQQSMVAQSQVGGMVEQAQRDQHLSQGQPQPMGLMQQQQQGSHLQQNTGPPPPPFMSNRGGYVQMDQQQQMMASQQPQQQQPPQATSVAQPLPPAQYANYYPAEFLPQSTPPPGAGNAQGAPPPAAYQQSPAGVGPGAVLNYVPAMQTAPQSQSPAQYSPYPGYQNYAAMPIQAAQQPPNNVAYYAAAPPPPQAAAVVPQQHPTQAQPPRPILSQRRPTNAIPIVPPDRSVSAAPATGGKGRGRLVSEMPAAGNAGGTAETSNTNDGQRQEGDDIDLILDTMFVRRPQQPMTSSTTSSSGRAAGEKAPSKTGDIDDAMKDLRLNTEKTGGGGGGDGPANSSEA